MGRRKIEILPIQHDRNRSVTFLKRKNGLFKKAYELGVLCSVDVAVIIFGHNNKVYEYCSTDSDTIVQRRLHYTGERDVKTPADFGGDKANNDDDEDGSDEPGAAAGASRIAPGANKFPPNGKKRTRDDEPSHMDYTSPGHLLHLQQPPPSSSRTTLPNISSLARGPPPVSLPLPPYASIQPQHHHHQPSSASHSHSHSHSADALMEREREREREREGALRQLGLQHLLNSTAGNPNSQNAGQYPPHPSHPSLVPNLNLASLLQAHPLLGLGVPGLNLGLGGLLAGAGGAGGGGTTQQDLLAMLSANAANVGGGNALYSNPLFSTLFPNHPGLGNDNNSGGGSGGGGGGGSHSTSNSAGGDSKGADLWPTLGRTDSNPAPVSTGSGGGGGGDTSWLSFLGNSRGSQPPSDDVDLSSLFPFDPAAPSNSIGGVGGGDDGDDSDRGGKRAKR